MDGIRKHGPKALHKILEKNETLKPLLSMSEEWGIDLPNVVRWVGSPEYLKIAKRAEDFIKRAPDFLAKIESEVGELKNGELRLGPSLMQFDGFARFDQGYSTVWFGVDHPDGDLDYLQALLAHELSHVYRESHEEVFSHTGKKPTELSRPEYLDQMTAREHIVSEGLATLFSQVIFPEIPVRLHHFYYDHEMKWCLENIPTIEAAIVRCLKTDQEVWKFYKDDVIAPGSPSRTHYFWSAFKLAEFLGKGDLKKNVIEAHRKHSRSFHCFPE